MERTTDGYGIVADMTLAEINALNHGYQFQDLEGKTPYREEKKQMLLHYENY